MSTTTAITTRPSALRLMADRCNVDADKLHQTLRNTVFKGATDDEMLALVVTANVYELNPLLKELYAFPKKGGGITPMVGVDGWLKIANRQPNYDGMTVEVYGEDKNPTHATCEIFLKDRTHPVKITEYFDECKRGTDPWNQMPRRMLRNKVIIQTIRVAFGIGGIHDEDEAADISDNAPREAHGRVLPDTNPYADAPKEAAKPAPAKQTRKASPAAAATVEAAPVEEPEAQDETPAADLVDMPSMDELLADLTQACTAAKISPQSAAKKYREYGVVPEGVKMADLTHEQLFEVWKVREIALQSKPEAAP